ncbi:methionyl-tRNA formyltransferase [Litoribacter ruber]|uniref:Methionyl-tRNA formyltransferase n=1 Tax=Litoribacter ruber TaxID=702568 RepID=A0AAP2G0L9_9BACT|nr:MULTISPECIES: methionyl-tRNA formyltransferase [Litoribacter]MBS9523084.1 methionyl-tRNA formyltransferase [Litoribacter alkaliphilus]MBT0810753.1 methionyl-tRNA formyltransferase [Litoribacter ruber]
MDKTLRIIYMGTPEFAVPSLDILVENGWNVVAVITAPDRPKGRGQKLIPSPVKEAALKHNLPVLQPTNLKDPEFIEELRSYKADLQIVVAFRMLPEAVWNMPSKGTFNLHASLLPNYRGAAPINWAIINGEKETGVTTFFLKHQIDTGNLIFQEKETILPEDNVGTLYERLMEKGSRLVLKTVEAIQEGTVEPVPQDESKALHEAPKIFKETCMIDWNQPAEKIHNLIRGLSPYPAAWTEINGKTCKIFASEIIEKSSGNTPGKINSDGKNYIHFHSQDNLLAIKELQLQGKKRMGTEEFLRGNKL